MARENEKVVGAIHTGTLEAQIVSYCLEMHCSPRLQQCCCHATRHLLHSKRKSASLPAYNFGYDYFDPFPVSREPPAVLCASILDFFSPRAHKLQIVAPPLCSTQSSASIPSVHGFDLSACCERFGLSCLSPHVPTFPCTPGS